jgi:hypothetical protein
MSGDSGSGSDGSVSGDSGSTGSGSATGPSGSGPRPEYDWEMPELGGD